MHQSLGGVPGGSLGEEAARQIAFAPGKSEAGQEPKEDQGDKHHRQMQPLQQKH